MSLNERLQYAAMKARHQNLFRPWYRKWWGIIIIILSAILVFLFIYSGIYVRNKVKEIRLSQEKDELLAKRQAYNEAISGDGTNYRLGSLNPKVTIIEFGDFACPICQQSAPAISAIMKKYPEQVKFVWRDYLIHENSAELALAARCAGEQGKFWEMHDILFANQNNLTATGDPLKTQLSPLLPQLNLDLTQFQDCYDSKKYFSQIQADMNDGDKLQIQGTPAWFVNNYPLLGFIPEEKFQELIEGLIN